MKKKSACVWYADLWGVRKSKYDWLDENDMSSTAWQKLTPAKPSYFLVPRDESGWELYGQFVPIINVFSVYSTGIVTARDHFVIDENLESLKARIRTFRDTEGDAEYLKTAFELKENYAWRVVEARDRLRKEKNIDQFFKRILYRPFDERWIFYHPAVVWRTRDKVMRNFLQTGNIGLVVHRTILKKSWHHAFVSDGPIDVNYIDSAKSAYLFPLAITYSEGQQSLLSTSSRSSIREKTNVSEALLTDLCRQLSRQLSSEELLYYVYSVLHSSSYCLKYQEFLRFEFPRIPFTRDLKLFDRLVCLGKQIISLHLMKSPALNKPIVKFYGEGDNRVLLRDFEEVDKMVDWPASEERPRKEHGGVVKINKSQFFGIISEVTWEYHVGGYQVLDKWLRDRKGRILSAEDIKHYCRVATAISRTIEVQKDIDKLYPDVEKNLLKLSQS